MNFSDIGLLIDTSVNIIIAAILSFILSLIYVHCGSTFSNRRQFSKNFYLLSMTIALIISIVKSSLALSLGLVGALSIVRYRAAIKEPEELAYLFVTIAIGLGLGANQKEVTIAAFLVIVAVILIRYFIVKKSKNNQQVNYNLAISVPIGEGGQDVNLQKVVDIVGPHCDRYKLKRFEITGELLDLSMFVEYKQISALGEITQAVQQQYPAAKVFFLDNTGD